MANAVPSVKASKSTSSYRWCKPRTLSDASEVFEVEFGEETIPSITDSDAEELARGIKTLINSHSNMTAGVVYG